MILRKGKPYVAIRNYEIAASCIIYPLKLKRDLTASNYLRPGDAS